MSLRVWTAHDSPSPPDIRSAKSEAAAVSTAVASRAGKKSDSASHGHEYEFGGPIGTTINTIALPFVILFLYTACPNGDGNFCLQGVDVFSLVNMPIPSAESLWSWQAMCLYLAWFGFLVFLERVLPYTHRAKASSWPREKSYHTASTATSPFGSQYLSSSTALARASSTCTTTMCSWR